MIAPKILIVDDEPDMRLAIGNVLRLRGYDVLEAGEGTGALELLSQENVSLVLLDMRLPGMNSMAVLEEARKLKGSVPVVMIAGYGHIHSAEEVFKLGASEYLQKPFENAQLLEVVRKFIASETAGRGKGVGREQQVERTQGKEQVSYSTLTSASTFPLTPQPLPAVEGQPGVTQNVAAKDECPAEVNAPEEGKAPLASAPVAHAAKRPLVFYALALFLAAGALALLLRWNAANAGYYRSYQARSSNISALAWRGNELWAGDWVSGSVYRYSKNADRLELIAQYPLEKTHITSLALAGDKLYVWDSWKKNMEIRRLDSSLSLINTISLPAKITGLSYDGEHFWLCDEQGNAALRSTDDRLPEIKTYRLAERADQIYRDGNYLWTAISSNGRLYRHRLDAGLSLEKTYIIKNIGTDYPLSAFTWRGGRLWVAMDGKGEITEFGKANLEEVKQS